MTNLGSSTYLLKEPAIRKGEEMDLPSMKRLFVQTITEVCSADYNAQQIKVWAASAGNEERWEAMMAKQYVLVAQLEAKIVGFASLADGGYLDFLYVHPDHLRQGIAHLLYRKIEAEAERQGLSEMESDVSRTAKPFFEKVGFKASNEKTVVRQGVELTNFKMKKRLA